MEQGWHWCPPRPSLTLTWNKLGTSPLSLRLLTKKAQQSTSYGSWRNSTCESQRWCTSTRPSLSPSSPPPAPSGTPDLSPLHSSPPLGQQVLKPGWFMYRLVGVVEQRGLCDDNSESNSSLCQFLPRSPACQEALNSLIRLFNADITLSSNLGEHSIPSSLTKRVGVYVSVSRFCVKLQLNNILNFKQINLTLWTTSTMHLVLNHRDRGGNCSLLSLILSTLSSMCTWTGHQGENTLFQFISYDRTRSPSATHFCILTASFANQQRWVINPFSTGASSAHVVLPLALTKVQGLLSNANSSFEQCQIILVYYPKWPLTA